MQALNGLQLPVLHILPQDLPVLNFQPKLIQRPAEEEEWEDPCTPGYVWNAETEGCEARITLRSPNCEWGYRKNIRLDECRRIKYNVGPQQKGTFRKWFDRNISPHKAPPGTSKPVIRMTTRYTDGWFGYGHNFGRNDPHW